MLREADLCTIYIQLLPGFMQDGECFVGFGNEVSFMRPNRCSVLTFGGGELGMKGLGIGTGGVEGMV